MGFFGMIVVIVMDHSRIPIHSLRLAPVSLFFQPQLFRNVRGSARLYLELLGDVAADLRIQNLIQPTEI